MQEVIYLTNIPAPYRVAQLNVAARHLKEHDILLSVIFAARNYKRRHYWPAVIGNPNFEYTFLKRFDTIEYNNRLFQFGFSLMGKLKKMEPSLIISTGFNLLSLIAYRYCKKAEIPYLIHSGETISEEKKRSRKILRSFVRNKLIKSSSGFLAYGVKAKEYLINKGIDSSEISICINSIDTDKFIELTKNLVRDKNDKTVRLLYVGNLDRMKGVNYLLQAVSKLKHNTEKRVILNIVGDGESRKELENVSKEFNLSDINFLGALRNEQILPLYFENDVFVFPSLFDIFGLVLVEAAASGLPLISSEFSGGSFDLIQEDKNGYIINPTDIDYFSAKLLYLIENDDIRIGMGLCSREIVEKSVNINISGLNMANKIISSIIEYS